MNSGLDIETWGLDAREDGTSFAIGAVFDERGVFRFTDRDSMRKWLESKENRNRVFWAHNGGRFDYLSIFGNYLKTHRPLMVGGQLIEFRIESGNNVTKFRDSTNLFRVPLSDIGEALGVSKGETPEKFKNATHEPILETDWEYLIRDCEIVYRAVEGLWAEFGELRATLPSLAMNYFRRKHLHAPHHRWGEGYLIDPLDTETRPAYHGARVEAYFLGRTEEAPYYYDINSLYSHAMVSTRFPDPERLRRGTTLPPDSEGVVFGTAHVPDDLDPPPLPYRAPDKLLFPTGTFGGAWAGPEYREALKLGVTFDIESTIYAPSIESPFLSFVDSVYRLKAETQGFRRQTYKLLLNALYGKFGEHHSKQTEYSEAFSQSRFDELVSEHPEATWKPLSLKRPDGFFTWENEDGERATNSVYIWAAYITSQARVVNLQTQRRLMANGARVLYTDTDSFLLSDCPAPSDMVGPNLGQLKYLPNYVSEIWGAKHYVEDGVTKLKGVRRNAEVVQRGADGRAAAYAFDSIVGAREAIRRNLMAGAPKKLVRSALTVYTKRSPPDRFGWTKPLRMGP